MPRVTASPSQLPHHQPDKQNRTRTVIKDDSARAATLENDQSRAIEQGSDVVVELELVVRGSRVLTKWPYAV